MNSNGNQFNPFNMFFNPMVHSMFPGANQAGNGPQASESNPWLSSWMQMADSWQKHWGQAYNFNGFSNAATPANSGVAMPSMAQMFNWQPNMPVLSFEQVFSPANWEQLSQNLQQAWQASDREAMLQTLRNLSEQWASFSHTHQPFWRKQSLALQQQTVQQWRQALDQNPWLNFPQFNEGVKESRRYLEAWQDCLESAGKLAEYFEEVEQKVSEQFAAKVLDDKVSIEDVKELFASWVGIFEESYNQACMQEEYRKLYTNWTKTLLNFREFVQESVDSNVELWGLPSKREMDSLLQRTSHDRKNIRKLDQRIVMLEQQVEQLGRQLRELQEGGSSQA